MDRRKSIKALVIGTVSTGALLDACKNKKEGTPDTPKEAVKEEPGLIAWPKKKYMKMS